MAFKLCTLKKRADFLRARSGRYHVTPGVILQASRSLSPKSAENGAGAVKSEDLLGRPAGVDPLSSPRFGFTASKKLGNAVARNRVKRRLREAVRRIAPQMARSGFEYVLIGRKSTLKRPFRSLLLDLTEAFNRVHGEAGGRPKRKGRRQQTGQRVTGGRSKRAGQADNGSKSS
jgi:ribonuclease P protein component